MQAAYINGQHLGHLQLFGQMYLAAPLAGASKHSSLLVWSISDDETKLKGIMPML
jgi:hypothetical protein